MTDEVGLTFTASMQWRNEYPTTLMRWLVPAETTTKPPVLQQKWNISTHAGHWEEWRDVPTEVAPPEGGDWR